MKIRRKQFSQTNLICNILGTYSGWIFSFILLFILIKLICQSSDVRESELDQVAQQLRINKPKAKENRISIIRPGSDLDCSEAKAKVFRKEWVDPNGGKVWARETITFPQFYISLHGQDYDPVRWRIMEEGKYYEDQVHKRFVEILENSSPSHVLDVGANIGYYTLLSASLGHCVISFEPNPANILRLCDSLKLNQFTKDPEIHLFQNAVADVHGEEMMLLSPKNPGQAFLRPLDGQMETDSHKAKTTVIMLDRFAEEQGWLESGSGFQIKLLKIDVEGKEPQVIMGSPKLLKSGIIEHILTEGRRFGRPNIRESFEILFEAQYMIKEPQIPIEGKTSAEKAKSLCDWYLNKFGKDSMQVHDMWWIRSVDSMNGSF
jgi:FkbM family methyltransferase